MADASTFDELMARVRAKDADAAAQLVGEFERTVRVAIRVRLTDPKLRRRFDSMDVCQSVFLSFFVRAAAGQYDLTNPAQLVALLMKIARNKLMMQVRRHRSAGRDVERAVGEGTDSPVLPDRDPGPARHAMGRELLSKLLDRLDGDERELAQRRAVGQEWKDIALDLGGTPQAHRMRLSRAIDRMAVELGIDDG